MDISSQHHILISVRDLISKFEFKCTLSYKEQIRGCGPNNTHVLNELAICGHHSWRANTPKSLSLPEMKPIKCESSVF